MSIHKSLVSKGVLERQRNVLNRWERIVSMRQQEQWEDGRSAFSLPKVKVVHHKKRHKAKKEAVDEAAEADGETPVEDAAAGEARGSSKK